MTSVNQSPTNQSAKFSLSLGRKKSTPALKRTPNPNPTGPQSTLHDSDNEDVSAAQSQEVSHFDQSAGGAIGPQGPRQETGPLVIKSQANRDWRKDLRHSRQRSGLPAAVQGHPAWQEKGVGGSGAGEDFLQASTAHGLTVLSRQTKGEEGGALANGVNGFATKANGTLLAAPEKQKTDDELALESLTGVAPQSTLTIPVVLSEDEAFQRDYESAPPPPTLDAYAAVPVEEFGAALLRGMGWKDGEAIGRNRGQQAQAVKPVAVKRRPALLGLGAKEDAALGVELGAWGKAARGGGKGKGGRKTEQSYNPLMMRNKATGEMITEEEFRRRLEEQKKMVFEEGEKDGGRDGEEGRERKRRRYEDEIYDGRDGRPSRRYEDGNGDYEKRDGDRRRREKEQDRECGEPRRNHSLSKDDAHRRRRRPDDEYRRSNRRDRSESLSSDDRRRRKDDRNQRRDRSDSRDDELRRRRKEHDDYNSSSDYRNKNRRRRDKDDRYASSSRRDRG